MRRELRAASCPGLAAPSVLSCGSRAARHRRCRASHGSADAGAGGGAEPQVSWLSAGWAWRREEAPEGSRGTLVTRCDDFSSLFCRFVCEQPGMDPESLGA